MQNKKIIAVFAVFLIAFAAIIFAYLQYQNNLVKKYSALLHQAITLQETKPLEAQQKIIDIYQNKKTPISKYLFPECFSSFRRKIEKASTRVL